MYFTVPKAPIFREPLFNPKFQRSREAMADEVKSILIFEEELPEEISSWDWTHHPAYIAAIRGGLKLLADILEPLGYEIRKIPVN